MTDTFYTWLLPYVQHTQRGWHPSTTNGKLVFRKWPSVSPVHATSCVHRVDPCPPPSPVKLSYLRCNILLSTSLPKRSILQTSSINQTLPNTLKQIKHTLSNTLHQSNTLSCTRNQKASLKHAINQNINYQTLSNNQTPSINQAYPTHVR